MSNYRRDPSRTLIVLADEGDHDDDGDQIMADRAAVRPSAGPVLLPPGYEDFRRRTPFADFKDLEGFTDGNRELTRFFVDHPRDPLAVYWLAQARRVVSGSILDLREHLAKPALLWEVIGRALNVPSENPGEVLAELYWVGKYDPNVNATSVLLEKHRDVYAAFLEKLESLADKQSLPDRQPMEVAPIAFGRYRAEQEEAQQWLETWIKGRQSTLVDEHGSTEEWLRRLGADPALGYHRALDRLADVITSFDGDRVCVAVLHRGREIGICANRPDYWMGDDLEALLRASRAVGDEARRRFAELLDQMGGRGGEEQLGKRSRERAEVRLLKTIAFLRDLERTHGRIRVVPYTSEIPVAGNGKEMEVHAEMVALTIGRKNPGASLGVGKLCCFKCWLLLNAFPGVFTRRDFATHMKTYPWPPPKFLTEPGALQELFSSTTEDSLPEAIQEAIEDRRTWPALCNALYIAQGDQGGFDTGYPSSEDELMAELAAEVLFTPNPHQEKQGEATVDPEEKAENDALFSDHYIDRDPLTPEERLPALIDDIPPPIQRDEPGNTPLTKTKRETAPTPPSRTSQPTTLESYGFTRNRPPSPSDRRTTTEQTRERETTRRGSSGTTVIRAKKPATSRKRKRS
ncbi:hypothetical protein [Acrocarpospora pleiomorpha]|nr:hypothetical protein [Acrocarpospora pleiomorpha]